MVYYDQVINGSNSESIYTYLLFRLGKESFAIQTNNIQEILKMKPIIKSPQLPQNVKGMVNYRGIDLPVIDARVQLNMPAIEMNENTCILVLNLIIDRHAIKLGVMVDSITSVLDIPADEIHTGTIESSVLNPRFQEGVINHEREKIIIIDAEKIFSARPSELVFTRN